jgi:hypothetical protein
MIVHCDSQILLGVILPYYILVEIFFYHFRLGHICKVYCAFALLFFILCENIAAEVDTFTANANVFRPFNKRIILAGSFAAETAYCFISFFIRRI